MPSIQQVFLNLQECINFCVLLFWFFQGRLLSTASSRAGPLASTHLPSLSSQRSLSVKWFSTQSAFVLSLSNGRYLRQGGPWKAVCAFGQSLFVKDFATGHNVRDVNPQSSNFVSHRSSGFLQIIFLIIFSTQLTAVLDAGSRVPCHSFRDVLIKIKSRKVVVIYVRKRNFACWWSLRQSCKGCNVARSFIVFFLRVKESTQNTAPPMRLQSFSCWANYCSVT
jgi:hypothetical protein